MYMCICMNPVFACQITHRCFPQMMMTLFSPHASLRVSREILWWVKQCLIPFCVFAREIVLVLMLESVVHLLITFCFSIIT